MSPMDLFWLFFMIMALQPVMKQKFLEASRQRMISAIEKKRGSRLILMVHRQETMSLLGFPVFRFIDVNDSEEVARAIHMTDRDMPLDLVLHTPGGLVLAAVQIARAIKRHQGKVTVFVPHYAMSGGTLIALAADEIVMADHAVLGPVDPQVGQMAAASVLSVLERKEPKDMDDQTLILADQAAKALRQVKNAVKELMSGHYSDDKAEELSDLLSRGVWTHDHPISFEEAKRLGLNVNDEMPEEILALMNLFPQPVRRQPSVEYVPVPRHIEPGTNHKG